MYKDLVTVSSHVTSVEAIKNSIRNILRTRRGSLPGKPRFGSDLWRVIFSPMDPLTEVMATRYVEEALQEYEDRIEVQSVVLRKEEAYNKIIVNISFKYKDYDFDTDGDLASVSFSINV